MSRKNRPLVISKEKLMQIEKSKHHRDLKEQGALDGRFQSKIVESKKKYKKPKHKGRDYDSQDVLAFLR